MTTDAVPAASDVPEVTPEAEMIDAERAAKERIERAMNAGVWPTSDWAKPASGRGEEQARKEAGSDRADDQPEATETTAATEAVPATDDAPATDEAPATANEQAAEPVEHAVAKRAVTTTSARAPKRENPLVAGLVKAMREAAIASRAETTTRLQAEATARVEAIREEATTQSAELRKRVDDDIAHIREWSKGEMARIRQETEQRIEARRTEAIEETEAHTEAVERRVEQVQAQVSAYEADMDRFFEDLLAENDPGKLATLAEEAPEPPDLSGELDPLPAEWHDARWSSDSGATTVEDEPITEATTEATAETAENTTPDATDPEPVTAEVTSDGSGDALEAADAAEAEATATEGLDMPADNAWPAAVLAAARRSDTAADATREGAAHSRLLVSGLTSVAGISAFKGALGQLPGVTSVSVTSGERGVFIFNVSHEATADIAEAVTGLTNFAVRITEASGDTVSVTAHEPAA